MPSATAPHSEASAVAGVIAMARYAGERHWVPATSGNFSVRIDDRFAAVTATGADKANLTEGEVIVAEIAGPKHARASAEAPLHLARYAADPSIGAIAHIHTLPATLLSRRHAGKGVLRLEGWELLKAFTGVTTHETVLDIPIVPNEQDTEHLAAHVEIRLKEAGPVPGYLIAGHGLYVWGATVKDAIRHMEAFDFILTAELSEENAK
ncbi:methylthioribulose 1-phosphate dehydratase [Parvibaculum sp.]|uniref:methylthioribulose 1-phosphate dehydratase n=1 Tax=Parvibaculum sp. TaxID=2024848 RepID=UPI002C64EE68|nr:methylthioribulose 1-phosphate dehydratase [Parvibaculum sp.]HUD50540.1 methylthioribulose 1-phosphate dehydratase [Parvibaculum sp.]